VLKGSAMPRTAEATAPGQLAVTDAAARQLANATKTTAQLDAITPRWLIRMLHWTPVEAGIYRLNRVIDPDAVLVACPPRDESELPTTYVGYEEDAREIFLNSVATIVDIHTRVSDLYSSPYDQMHSAGNAPAAECHRPRSACSARNSSPGAGSR
jgi:Phage capsid-like protein